MKTYSHLAHLNRMPTEYELLSTRLDYFNRTQPEVQLSLRAWCEKYRCTLECENWDEFYDPRETTYAKYTNIQKEKEIYVDGILHSIDEKNYDRSLSEEWVLTLSKILPVLRFPAHGMEMVAAYIAHLAPSSRVTIAALFQSADEMRFIQRIAYRMVQLQNVHPDFGRDSKTRWSNAPMWQPLRSLTERLLVTYDWVDSFVGLNLCMKPIINELTYTYLQEVCIKSSDYLMAQILASFYEDFKWHKNWSLSLTKILASQAKNREPLNAALKWWLPQVIQATSVFRDLDPKLFDEFMTKVQGSIRKELQALDLSVPKLSHGKSL